MSERFIRGCAWCARTVGVKCCGKDAQPISTCSIGGTWFCGECHEFINEIDVEQVTHTICADCREKFNAAGKGYVQIEAA